MISELDDTLRGCAGPVGHEATCPTKLIEENLNTDCQHLQSATDTIALDANSCGFIPGCAPLTPNKLQDLQVDMAYLGELATNEAFEAINFVAERCHHRA